MTVLLILSCVGDIVANDGGTDSTDPTLWPIELSPDGGPATGGTFVRIVGLGFTSASTVTVGGAPCAALTFLSDTELYCTTPPGVVGETTLSVGQGAEAESAPFTYLDSHTDTADTGEPPARIDACTLDSPTTMEAESNEASPAVLATVLIDDRTVGAGQPPGVDAELGFGNPGSDTNLWAWFEMDWSVQAGEGDQYSGTFVSTRTGIYDYSVRFRVDHGDWTVCQSSTGTYGVVEVVPPTNEEAVDYCHLQWPCSLTVAPSGTSDDVYAWIYQGGVTDGTGQGNLVRFDLGVGARGSDPETDPSWTWSRMDYFSDQDGLSEGDVANDEYVGTFRGPSTVGTYDYVARASADDGLTWTLCDLGGDSCNEGGSSDGYDNPGTCTVE